MKKLLRDIKMNAVLSAIVCVVLGLVLVIWPSVVGNMFCYVVGGALLLSGISYIVSYFRNRDNASLFQGDFLLGLIFSVIGLWIILKPDVIISLIPILFGIVILLHGFMDVQQALNLKRAGYDKWGAALAVSIITVGFGATLLFNPLMAANIGIMLMGVGLIFDGVSELWVLSRVSKYIGHD